MERSRRYHNTIRDLHDTRCRRTPSTTPALLRRVASVLSRAGSAGEIIPSQAPVGSNWYFRRVRNDVGRRCVSSASMKPDVKTLVYFSRMTSSHHEKVVHVHRIHGASTERTPAAYPVVSIASRYDLDTCSVHPISTQSPIQLSTCSPSTSSCL